MTAANSKVRSVMSLETFSAVFPEKSLKGFSFTQKPMVAQELVT